MRRIVVLSYLIWCASCPATAFAIIPTFIPSSVRG